MQVEVDLDLNAYANARRHFEQRRAHATKQAKTVAANEKALKAAEKKAEKQLSQARPPTSLTNGSPATCFQSPCCCLHAPEHFCCPHMCQSLHTADSRCVTHRTCMQIPFTSHTLAQAFSSSSASLPCPTQRSPADKACGGADRRRRWSPLWPPASPTGSSASTGL